MNRDRMSTRVLSGEIENCADIDELKQNVFPLWFTQQEQWTEKINEILTECNMSKSAFAHASGISRVSVNKWCNGAIPKNRETFLRIGMTAGYDIEQMNQLLTRYGRYPELYPKSLEDCVCIFILEHQYGLQAIDEYKKLLDRIRANITEQPVIPGGDIPTEQFYQRVKDLKSEMELEWFVNSNSETFKKAYMKFYAYVIRMIKDNYLQNGEPLYDLVAAQKWSSSLKQCAYAIFQKKWYPTRNKIISLGLHLSMDRAQINKMLELAHMEPLCAKNLFEGVIIFILENASLNELIGDNANCYDPDELFDYVRSVLLEMDLPEVEFFISEFSEEEEDRW